jgi:tRNA(Ile)-lysidine synthase
MVLWQLLEDAGLNVHLAHVNYQLRGAASEKDQAFIEGEAKKQKTKLHLLRAETKKQAVEKKQSTQLAAREIRYDWFEDLMQKHNYSHLLTAHHLDDSIETFFINLDRGTGLKGITGIHSHSYVMRPLLDFTKAEIIAFAESQNVPFREDASNADSDYLRNWFRNELLPLWKAKNPAFESIMSSNMQRMQEAQRAIDDLIEDDLAKLPDNINTIAFEKIKQMKLPKHSLMQLLETKGFNFTQVEQLLKSINRLESGKQFFSDAYQITVDREALFISEIPEKNINGSWIQKETSQIKEPICLHFTFMNTEEVDWKQGQTEYFDAAKLQFPLELRKWKQGDRMKPLGMKGSKLVSDLLIDAKVPLHQKQQTYVLLSDEQLIAVIGLRISEDFKVTKQTQETWQIQWEK